MRTQLPQYMLISLAIGLVLGSSGMAAELSDTEPFPATADLPGSAEPSGQPTVPIKPEGNALPSDIPAREINAPAALEEITTDVISAMPAPDEGSGVGRCNRDIWERIRSGFAMRELDSAEIP